MDPTEDQMTTRGALSQAEQTTDVSGGPLSSVVGMLSQRIPTVQEALARYVPQDDSSSRYLAMAAALGRPTAFGGIGETMSNVANALQQQKMNQDKLRLEYLPHIMQQVAQQQQLEIQRAQTLAGYSLMNQAIGGGQGGAPAGGGASGLSQGPGNMSPVNGAQPTASNGLNYPLNSMEMGADLAFNGGKGFPGMIAKRVEPNAFAQQLIQSGMRQGSPEFNAAMAAHVAKENNIPPVVNRGFGLGTMVDGKYVPDQASLDQALALERGKQDITAPMEQPVTIDLSGGQKAQLSRPEYANFQKTGQLPQRYQQAQQPPQTQPLTQPGDADLSKIYAAQVQKLSQNLDAAQKSGDPMAMQRAQSDIAQFTQEVTRTKGANQTPQTMAGLGIPGLTQSQPEQVQQASQMAEASRFGTERGALTAEKPVATLAFNDAASNLDRLSAIAKEIANHPGLSNTVGLMGALPNIPGSNASDAAAKLETLKSQAAFSVLQAMRNASKTGGALGQVSDREEQMLANNLAALQKAQSPKALKDSLVEISTWAARAKERMQNAYDMTYNNASAMPPAGTNSGMTGNPIRTINWGDLK